MPFISYNTLHERVSNSFFSLFTQKQNRVRITDQTGVIGRQRSFATYSKIWKKSSTTSPTLTTPADFEQALALAKTESEHFTPTEPVVIVATK
jgi:hypothetical protein